MLKIKTLTSLLLFFYSISVLSQFGKCGTKSIDSLNLQKQPHYGNNEFLNEVLNIDTHFHKNDTFLQTDIFHIPVKVWVFSDDNGDNQALSKEDVYELIQRVNEFHTNNNTKIQFYLKCAISFVNSSSSNLITSKSEFDNTLDSRGEPKSMNWFFVNDIDWVNSDGISVGGAAYYPWQNRRFKYAIETGGGISDWLVSSTVHEVGHNLGLAHTFDGRRGNQFYNGDVNSLVKQELVGRKHILITKKYFLGILISVSRRLVCEVNGDAICDTEANPRRLSGLNMVNCNYVGEFNNQGNRRKEKDLLNWEFTPQERNFMAYTPTTCRDQFTQGQIAVMRYNIVKYMYNFESSNYVPWFNRNIILTDGTIYENQIKSIYSSQKIITKNEGLSINSNGKANFLAQESITLNPGFHSKRGSSFNTKIKSIENCNLAGKTFLNNQSFNSYFKTNYTTNNINSLLKKNVNEESIEEDEIVVESIEIYNPNEVSKASEQTKVNFNIFPNPASKFLHFSSNKEVNYKIEISDLNSNIVEQFKSSNRNMKVDITKYPKGIYFAKIISKKYVNVFKIVIK